MGTAGLLPGGGARVKAPSETDTVGLEVIFAALILILSGPLGLVSSLPSNPAVVGLPMELEALLALWSPSASCPHASCPNAQSALPASLVVATFSMSFSEQRWISTEL